MFDKNELNELRKKGIKVREGIYGDTPHVFLSNKEVVINIYKYEKKYKIDYFISNGGISSACCQTYKYVELNRHLLCAKNVKKKSFPLLMLQF